MTSSSKEAVGECCMCGDCGLSTELFQCQICTFRSQHRYCSNLYPRAESYRACNWCLKKESPKSLEQPHKSSLTCTIKRKHSNNIGEDDHDQKKKKVKINTPNGYSRLSVKVEKDTCEFYLNSPIKKERPLSNHVVQKKGILSNCRIKEEALNLRRTKSEEIVKNGIERHVFRGRVRRYKLLEDVTTQ